MNLSKYWKIICRNHLVRGCKTGVVMIYWKEPVNPQYNFLFLCRVRSVTKVDLMDACERTTGGRGQEIISGWAWSHQWLNRSNNYAQQYKIWADLLPYLQGAPGLPSTDWRTQYSNAPIQNYDLSVAGCKRWYTVFYFGQLFLINGDCCQLRL